MNKISFKINIRIYTYKCPVRLGSGSYKKSLKYFIHSYLEQCIELTHVELNISISAYYCASKKNIITEFLR